MQRLFYKNNKLGSNDATLHKLLIIRPLGGKTLDKLVPAESVLQHENSGHQRRIAEELGQFNLEAD